MVDRFAFERTDQIAVAQHEDAVGGLDDLIQPVRDEDDRDAVRLEAGNHLQQLLGLCDRQARCRLVQNDEARLEAERLGDLDDLLLGKREPRDRRRRRERRAEAVEKGLDGLLELVVVDQLQKAVLPRLPPDVDVRRDARGCRTD